MRYLLLTYYRKPDGKIDESMTVSKRINPSDLQTANVIIDFKKLEVVKASMSGTNVPKNFDNIVRYYAQHYESTIRRLFNENGYEMTLEKKPSLENES
jgi:hypothetical protein